MTRAYFRRWLEDELDGLFEEPDIPCVSDWIWSHRRWPKVVLVGSGFSRNAELITGLGGAIETRVPLWQDITAALRQALGYSDGEGPTDPLIIAEQYQVVNGVTEFREFLLGTLKDTEICPGEAHNALQRYPIEAIITTNQLDTLLDRMEGNWHRVRQCVDLPLVRALASKSEASPSAQVIYLHGHRDAPQEWVFTRSEYEDVTRTRPIIVNRVQQLLSEYPLLVIGYSLSDPDFHSLFRLVHGHLGGSKPRGLCITAGSKAPHRADKTYWETMGLYLAQLSTLGTKCKYTSRSRQIANFLSLETRRPSKSYVCASIEDISRDSMSSTILARVAELASIYDDLELVEPLQHELAELRHNAWEACLPQSRQHRDDTEELNHAYINRRSATNADLTASESTHADAGTIFRFQILPMEQFEKYRPPWLPWILVAVDKLLIQQHEAQRAQIMNSIGHWVAFALDRGVIRERTATLDGNTQEGVHIGLLDWIVNSSETNSTTNELKACLEQAEARSESSTLTSLHWVAHESPYLLPEMVGAWNAVWSVNYKEAARLYGEAAAIFRKRNDAIGEWRALGGLIDAIQSDSFVFWDKDEDTRIHQANRIRDAEEARRGLEGKRIVRRHESRRDRVVAGGYKEALDKASRGAVRPGSQRRHFTVIPFALRSFLSEEAAARTHPGELRELVSLGLKNGLFGEDEGLLYALQYSTKNVDRWLDSFGFEVSLSAQRDRDVRLCKALRTIVDGLLLIAKGDQGGFPKTIIAECPGILPTIALRMDAETATLLANGYLKVCCLTEMGDLVAHSFGHANLPAHIIPLLPQFFGAISGQELGGKGSLELARGFLELSTDQHDQQRMWRALSQCEWGPVLASGGVIADDILSWLLNVPLSEDGDLSSQVETRASWLEAINNVCEAAQSLRHGVSDGVSQRLLEVSNREFDNYEVLRIRSAALEVLVGQDKELARRKAVELLLALSHSLRGPEAEFPNLGRRRLRRWFMTCVEQRMIDRSQNVLGEEPREALSAEVSRLILEQPEEVNRFSNIVESKFVFVAYTLAFGFAPLEAREWLISEIERQEEPPVRSIGLCASEEFWGDQWGRLVAILSSRVTDSRIFETLSLAHNALLDIAFPSTLVRGDLSWILLLAAQQVYSDNSDIAGYAARIVIDIAQQLTDDDLRSHNGAAILRALENCGKNPDPSVRAAVAYGLSHLVYQAKSAELAMLARRIVGVEGDPFESGLVNDWSGTIRGYVRFGLRAGEAALREHTN